MIRRATVTAIGTLLIALVLSACSSTIAAPQQEPGALFTPGTGSTEVSPLAEISVIADRGTLQDVALTSAAGTEVQGALSTDQTKFTVAEPLGYGSTYTWSGAFVNAEDGARTPLQGSFSTVEPAAQLNGRVNIGDDQEVGIAAPIILQFDQPVSDKAAVERALTVTTDPPTEGSWAWLPDEAEGSRVHWRPREYWQPGTTVTMTANLYGQDFGDGMYGGDDLSTSFTIGRAQIVKADVTSHRMVVERDGETIMDIPVSYGAGTEARNTTRNGVHVVSELHEDFLMSNPPYYENVPEKWAVRISNNGEFIHANPATTGVQGYSNVSNGCINLSLSDAERYFSIAMYGDPVEVTGSPIELSLDDGDIADWAFDWASWKAMSALA
jgi:lipoprotein-anchoring transpeptidase ErfK/SrfK